MVTAKQAACRMNGGHVRILAALESGKLIDTRTWSCGELSGLRKVHSTLSHWGAIDRSGLTEFGRQCLAAYRDRFPRATL